MNQELMTLDFWQDTVIYEGKTFPVGTLACDALNVPADTIAKMNEQCEKLNLLLGMLNAGQDSSALFPMARDAALALLGILGKIPPFSYMDIPKHREQIEKVFTADNALKYMKEDFEPMLEITTAEVAGQMIEIRISDNGIGIKKEHAKHIFEKFYRVSTGNLHDVKGFGLGLAYVKKMITAFRGTINVESEYGVGSTFIIKLPLVEDV